MKINNHTGYFIKAAENAGCGWCIFLTVFFIFIQNSITFAQDETINNVSVTVASGTIVTNPGNVTFSNSATISNSGALNIGGNWTNNNISTLTVAGTGTVNLNGTSTQIIGGLNSSTYYNLTLNNSNGASLSKPASVTNYLTLTSGRLFTTLTNLLSVTKADPGAISGGSTSTFIDGPVKWNLGYGTHVFPVGNGSANYYPFTLATSVVSSPVITVQAYNGDAGAGATYDGTLSEISHTEYWNATLNSGSFTGLLSLTRQIPIGTMTTIGQSSAQPGTYSSIGGTVSGTSIINSNSISTLGYFVLGVTCFSPTITSDPSDQTVCDGANTSFSVTASGMGLSYQWQEYISSWSDLSNGGIYSNVTTSTMNLTGVTSGMSGRYYRCVVSGCSSPATSAFATLTIDSDPAISTQPTNQTACESSTAAFTVYASGSALTYQWQVNTGSGWNNITTAGSNPTYSDWTTLTLGLSGITNSNNGYQYRCYLTTNCGGNATSNSASLTVNPLSVAPTSINSSANPICPSGSTTLSVVGGSLGTGATWKWYSGSCGGTLEGTGTSIIVFPSSSTTYYVRAEGTCNTTGCASLTVTLNTESTAASDIGISSNPICQGGSTTLNVNGGTLGTGASWKWYTASCGGTFVNTGPSIIVSPSTNTTYYVRAEGTCNTTSCVTNTVTVNLPSIQPSGASAAPASIVSGSSSTLTVTGGSLGTGAYWQWYSGSCGGSPEGTGSSIIVSPTITTTYYVRAEGGSPCNPTSCASVTVTVSSNSPVGVYLAGAKIWIESGAKVWIDGDANGDFTDASGGGVDGVITLDGLLKLEGDWTNNSNGDVLNTSTINGTVEFAGTTFQNIGGSHLTTFENLMINNSNADPDNVIIEDNMYDYFNTVKGTLTLTNGALILNNNKLIVENSSSNAISVASGYVVSESEDSRLQWNIGTNTGTYTYPFGRYSGTLRYVPFVFTVTSPGVGSGNVILSTYHTPSNNLSMPDSVDNLTGADGTPDNSLNMADRYWRITPVNYSTKPTATISFYYEYVNASDNEFYSPNTIIESDLQAQRWNGTAWEPPVGAVNTGSHFVQVPNVSTFSPWVLVTRRNPLPVELLDFNASCKNELVEVSWSTASELNCDRFDIEKSKDLVNWYFVGTVSGAGTTNELKEYNYNDPTPYSGISYYSLKQIDFDGSIEKYGPVSTECIDAQSNVFEILNIVANETHDLLTISYNVFENCKIRVYLIDALGQQLSTKKENANAGLNILTLPVQRSLCIGIYMVTIEYNDKIFTQKIFIH